MDNLDIELLKLNVNNSIAKRQMIISLFALLVSGTVGTLFISNSLAKYILIIIGCYYSCLMILNYRSNENELYKFLSRKR